MYKEAVSLSVAVALHQVDVLLWEAVQYTLRRTTKPAPKPIRIAESQVKCPHYRAVPAIWDSQGTGFLMLKMQLWLFCDTKVEKNHSHPLQRG